MKISIITVCLNNEQTIEDTIKSVISQSYKNIEYIIVDGKSSDNTLNIINKYSPTIDKFISEPDIGIYNAMNKGIKLASGEVIGILNADDYFTNTNIVEKIASEFELKKVDSVFGDVQFVNPKNVNRIVRYYSSKNFNVNKFRFGIMPAHPSFYVRSDAFINYGYYKEDYRIASDFELLMRFLYKNQLTYSYINFPVVTMRTGGASNKSIKSRLILNKEILRACKENNINTNLFYIYQKYLRKVFEFIRT